MPFATVAFCWWQLLSKMGSTTGELKFWITPENLIKGVAIVFVTIGVVTLSVLGIMRGDTAGALLSGLIGYTLGATFQNRDRGPDSKP